MVPSTTVVDEESSAEISIVAVVCLEGVFTIIGAVVQVDDVVNDALLLLLLLLLSAITTCRSELATCNKLGEVSTAVALEEIRVDF